MGRVINGWLNYYAVPGRARFLERFIHHCKRLLMRALRRWSQRDRTTWKDIDPLAAERRTRSLCLGVARFHSTSEEAHCNVAVVRAAPAWNSAPTGGLAAIQPTSRKSRPLKARLALTT